MNSGELEKLIRFDEQTVGVSLKKRGDTVQLINMATSPTIAGWGRFDKLYFRGLSKLEGDVVVGINNDGQFLHASRIIRKGGSGGGSRVGSGRYPLAVLEEMSLTVGRPYRHGPVRRITEIAFSLSEPPPGFNIENLPFNPIVRDFGEYASLIEQVDAMRQAAMHTGIVVINDGENWHQISISL